MQTPTAKTTAKLPHASPESAERAFDGSALVVGTHAEVFGSPRKPFVWGGVALLLLATVHCAASLFFVNYSYLDLKAYAVGKEKMPYQGRLAMMPIIAMAGRSPRFVALTAKIDDAMAAHPRSAFKSVTPEEFACMIVGGFSLLFSVSVATIYGMKRFPRLWWLPPSLMLAMLYVTQSARYETALWYPYDLPHAALFGTACVLVLEGAWLPVLLLFTIDLPVRETGIFLVGVCLTVGWARGQFRQALTVSGLMVALWVPFRIYLRHRFAGNASELGLHYSSTLHVLMNPLHWPQIASAFGFLLVPMVLSNRRLSRPQRAFMLGALPCLAVTLAFGVWSETRIFGEWLLPAAVLMSAEVYRQLPADDLTTLS